jgi:hypothetical protein
MSNPSMHSDGMKKELMMEKGGSKRMADLCRPDVLTLWRGKRGSNGKTALKLRCIFQIFSSFLVKFSSDETLAFISHHHVKRGRDFQCGNLQSGKGQLLQGWKYRSKKPVFSDISVIFQFIFYG